jgi:RND family efflux transporter MFP subunit
VAGLIVVVGAALGGFLVTQHVIKTTPTVARMTGGPIPVLTVPATRTDLKESLGAIGFVVPIDYASLNARVVARVEQVYVTLGDIVTPGTVLVRFQTDALKAAVTSAQAQVERANADLGRSRLELERLQKVYDQGLLAIVDVEKAQAAVDAAQQALATANTQLVEANRDLSYAVITAPAASVVTQRTVNPGETPALNSTLLVLGRINPVLVGAQVSEEHLGAVGLKQPATVTFTAFLNEEFQGEVVRMDPTANSETRTFQAFVRLDNASLRIKPGLTAFVRLERMHPGALTVPSVALMYPSGLQESTLFTVESDRARLRRVKIGVMAEGKTTILEGLNEGEKVVTVGQLGLRDGDRVRLGDGDVKLSDRSNATTTSSPSSGAR